MPTALDAAEAALNEFVREYCVDNPMDSINLQVNQIMRQIHEAGPKGHVVAAQALSKLEDLYKKMLSTLESQKTLFAQSIGSIETAIQQRAFDSNARPGLKRKRDREHSKRRTDTASPSSTKILEAKQQVAAKVARSHDLWILACIVQHIPRSNSYEVEDEDSGDEGEDNGHRHHIVSANLVVGLPQQSSEWDRYEPKARVLAMYPNTTSFYQATVVVPNPEGSTYVVVRFDDDADETGHNPIRKIPYRYTARLPDHLKTQ